MTQSPAIRLAIIGAGRFARESHMPALQALGPQVFEIRAICSRSVDSAQALAAALPYAADVTTSVEAVLARDDIDAVDIVVPVPDLAAVVEQALLSGKHVISEKPIATDTETARALMALQHEDQVWMVAENYRYHPGYRQAAELIHNGEIGRLLMAHYVAHIPITPETPWFQATWRQEQRYAGGMLLGAGVHHIAGLRMTLGEIDAVNATTTQMSHFLNRPDTLVANLSFSSGLLGHYAVTYATGPGPMLNFMLSGEGGQVNVTRQGIVLRHGENDELQLDFGGSEGVHEELRGFAQAIRSGASHLNSAQDALQDLAVIEAMLRSAENETWVEVEQMAEPLPELL